MLAGGGALALAERLGLSAASAASGQPARGVPLGGALQSYYFDSDPAYRDAFLGPYDLIMPMNALKFDQVQPTRDGWNFEPADQVLGFAEKHGKLSRGHCHVWWGATPDWVEAIETEKEAEAALVGHIERVCDRYRGRLTGWDVVNEVIANDPIEEGRFLRDTVWLQKLGPRHIPLAFETAARADPGARLVVNDYALEFVGPRYDARRRIMLDIVRQLQDRNVQIHGVGVQGHLYADRTIDRDALEAFHRTLDRMGVSLLVTELDVIDWVSDPAPEAQDRTAYRLVSDFLDGVFAWKPPEMVVVWGVSDRHSWVTDVMSRPDGAPSRPLPLDRDLKPKRWMSLLRQRTAAAAKG